MIKDKMFQHVENNAERAIDSMTGLKETAITALRFIEEKGLMGEFKLYYSKEVLCRVEEDRNA